MNDQKVQEYQNRIKKTQKKMQRVTLILVVLGFAYLLGALALIDEIDPRRTQQPTQLTAVIITACGLITLIIAAARFLKSQHVTHTINGKDIFDFLEIPPELQHPPPTLKDKINTTIRHRERRHNRKVLLASAAAILFMGIGFMVLLPMEKKDLPATVLLGSSLTTFLLLFPLGLLITTYNHYTISPEGISHHPWKRKPKHILWHELSSFHYLDPQLETLTLTDRSGTTLTIAADHPAYGQLIYLTLRHIQNTNTPLTLIWGM